MAKKKKLTRKDFELLPDPVWVEEDGVLQPTLFFLEWWQQVAEMRFGDKDRLIDAALELGYVGRCHDRFTGQTHLDPIGFDYDPGLYRSSLGLPADLPLISNNGSSAAYRQLWDKLLKEV